MDITLYFVGEDEEKARESMPLDSLDSARSYADDFGPSDVKIYSVTATIDFTTMAEEK